MPSPLGHALGGLIVGLVVLRTPLELSAAAVTTGSDPVGAPGGGHGTLPVRATRALWACVAIACLPDIDFLWGRHSLETHSIGAAAITGLAALAYTRGRDVRLALACALAVASHVLFDYLGSDDREPLGVMALWPFSTDSYFAHAYIFEAISRRYWLSNFVPHNAWAVLKEILLLAPAALALFLWRAQTKFKVQSSKFKVS
jgi:membrane-bound metal-dependent hydrolase YbcI (DUF457 family)